MLARILIIALLLFPLSVRAESVVTVTENEVADAIRKEFVEQGHQEEIDLEFFGGQTTFEIKDASEAKLLVSDLRLDELQNKFACELEVFANGVSTAKTNINGKYYVLKEAWVPAVNIGKDEIITETKLKPIKVRINRVKPTNVVDKESLVNSETKRSLKEGKLINDKEIGKKVVIKKGDVVTVMYKTKAMVITAKAEALGNASRGDKIELINVKSKKMMYGVAVDEDTVEVEAGM